MGYLENYQKRKKEILNDKNICKENRDIIKAFLEEKEYELKRKRKVTQINDKIVKTLNGYLNRLRNVNSFFNNKPWKQLSKEDIKKVYDDLEEGKIKNKNGEPFKDKESYYNKIMKSRPFQLAGKDSLAKEVIFLTDKEQEVRFITEEDFKKALSVVIQPKHKLALQLGWDIGENMSSILQLRVKDCKRKINEETKEPEYNIRLNKEILKTGRKVRTEPTLYPESVQLLDIVLQGKEPEEYVFDFGKREIGKVWKRAINKTKIRAEPEGQVPCVKDIRSGMACCLLNKGWNTDEIKERLGHSPSSTVIDKYVNYMAISRKNVKKKTKNFDIQKLKDQIEDMQQREKLQNKRNQELKNRLNQIEEILNNLVNKKSKSKVSSE